MTVGGRQSDTAYTGSFNYFWGCVHFSIMHFTTCMLEIFVLESSISFKVLHKTNFQPRFLYPA